MKCPLYLATAPVADGRHVITGGGHVHMERPRVRSLWTCVRYLCAGIRDLCTQAHVALIQLRDTSEYIIADSATPEVVFHPQFRQGQPTVNGIRAETLAGLVAGGEPIGFVASTYELTTEQVEQAVAYEASRRRAA